MNLTVLVVIGSIIILVLAVYAGYLLFKLKKQKALLAKHQALAVEKRNANIFDNVNTLCMVGIQGQCDLSELSIRIYCIMDYVQGEQRVDFEQTYPAISELYHIVKDMARGEARQALPKQERMKQNLSRMKAEERLHEAINQELHQLRKDLKATDNQILVQTI
ncbi:hypothetical protein VA7868_02655 [Vibrio aerogenes CECT 7868]|uniref:DUF2489 domain-containing protein n=1 Tax=Vibrio aerogenes CECT 7868 TaxID=1216006 RepID=A0A1M5ZFA8_9VIBR|nr:DUF2489 domain-containing protein [Vibrio aerogenes]SHI22841.1 hypothetical protein VA7868_02655 [Vibrio aerogenes CECT 7868]